VLVWLGVFLGVVGGMIYGACKVRIEGQKKKLVWFGAWFLMSVLMVSNILALDMTYAERWTYFALMGMIGFLVMLTRPGLVKKIGKPTRIILVSLVVVSLSVRTWVRVGDWKDGLTLYESDIIYAFESHDLQNNMGVELFRVGKMEEAVPYFKESIRLNPEWWTAYNNLGVYYQRIGDTGEARRLYKLSIEKGDYFLAWENLAVIKVQAGDEDAKEFVLEGLRRLPNNVTLRKLWVVVNQDE